MSAWRREVLKRFPEREPELRHCLSIFDALSQLERDLRAVYAGQRSEPGLADRLFEFAAWCYAPKRAQSVRNAVAVGFYEHLPNHPRGRADLATRLPFETLVDLSQLFFRMNTPESFAALQAEVANVHGRRLPEPGRAAS
jgi:hypothetical protein